MRQVIVVGARTNELLAETALHRGLHWRLAIFRDADFSFPIQSVCPAPISFTSSFREVPICCQGNFTLGPGWRGIGANRTPRSCFAT
jgi:hypothetical protein